jgi:hypothetical protein
VVALPKQVQTMLTISSGTTAYPFVFNTITGVKRVILHGIDVIKPGASAAPLIQVGASSSVYYTSTAGSYVGQVNGNNGGTTTLFVNSGIYCWNQPSGSSAVWNAIPADIYVDFQYQHSNSGYQVWSVRGAVMLTSTSSIYYANFINGQINFNSASYPNFGSVRLLFSGGAPTSGLVNVLLF